MMPQSPRASTGFSRASVHAGQSQKKEGTPHPAAVPMNVRVWVLLTAGFSAMGRAPSNRILMSSLSIVGGWNCSQGASAAGSRYLISDRAVRVSGGFAFSHLESSTFFFATVRSKGKRRSSSVHRGGRVGSGKASRHDSCKWGGGNLASLEPFEQSGGVGSQRRVRLGRSWLHDRHLSENNRGLWPLLNTIAIIPCLTRCIRTQALGESAFVRGVLAFVGGIRRARASYRGV